MARVNVYLPDELADRARSAGLNVSALTQEAITRRLAESATSAWLEAFPKTLAHPVGHDIAYAALDAARNEPTTHHG